MNIQGTQRKVNKVMIMIMVALFCVFSFLILPTSFSIVDMTATVSNSSVMEEYEQFNNSLMQMFEQYQNPLTEQISANNVGVEHDSNRLIVTSSEDLDDCGAVAKAEFQSHHIFQYQNAQRAKEAYEYYSALNCVEDVSYDLKVTVSDLEIEATDTTYNVWGQNYVGFNEYKASMLELTGDQSLSKVVVAVLDSGINTSHVLFEGRILTKYAKNYTTTDESDYEDESGHGSHVSGVIASATLDNVMILPLRVLDANGDGWSSWIIDAVDYLIAIKPTLEAEGYLVNVMNMSLGVKSSTSTGDIQSKKSSSLTNAVVNAYNAGIMAVVSAGNESQDTSYAIPANVDCAVTVSALKNNGTDASPSVEFDESYSNYGKHVDFSAPGTKIQSAWKGSSEATAKSNGTSMAAPHVTAAVSLIYSNPFYKDYSIDEVYNLLKENCYDLGAEGWDNKYGYGAICVGNIGVLYEGNVDFSVSEKFHDSQFSLKLSYDNSLVEDDEKVSIYYSIDPYVSSIDENATPYENEIVVDETTKITAIAYVRKIDTGVLVKKSYISTATYYFDDIDLDSNFETASYGNYVYITKYKGELTTLSIKTTIKGNIVKGISSSAFNSSNVSILTLPYTINVIGTSAFSGNMKLTEIYCDSTSGIEINANAFKNCSNLKVVEFNYDSYLWGDKGSSITFVGDYAFRNCASLEMIDLTYVTNIGCYAFANCTKLKDLFMPSAVSIEQHAFSVSGVEKIFIGKNISVLENQVDLNINKIYGYAGTLAETMAYNHNIEFVDLTLRIEEDLPTKKIIKTSENVQFRLVYTAFIPDFDVFFSGTTSYGSYKVSNINDYTNELIITLNNGHPTGKFDLYVQFYGDYYSSTLLKSNTINLEIVADNAETYTVDYQQGNFLVYVDDELITPSTLLYKGLAYDFKVLPAEGYDLNSVMIGGVTCTAGQTVSLTNNEDTLSIVANSVARETLNVKFASNEKFDVIVDGEIVNEAVVHRGESLKFKLNPQNGYKITRVLADGKLLLVDEQGNYVIENVLTDINIDILYEKQYYSLTVSVGKGGSVSTEGNVVLSGFVEFGASGSYNFNSYDGYRLDFVSVNGQIVQLENMEFDLQDIDQNYEIVVSFVESDGLAGANPMIMTYLFVFIGLFVVFVIGKILVAVIKKEKNKE